MAPIDALALRSNYSQFLRAERVLLTGHSHQAWPDVARAALVQAYDDAALHVDDKWSRALAMADRVRVAVSQRIDCTPGEIALGQNTHELICRFLSALDLGGRPHLVTTRGEFHSLDRQLRRLGEAGLRVTFVEPYPLVTLARRLVEALEPDTAALLASLVLFETSARVPGLEAAALEAQGRGVEVLIDAYHAFNVLPFSVRGFGARSFCVAGGYKYAQWGEGCCFMRVPEGVEWRPVLTGWFADFTELVADRKTRIGYGGRPADRFAGSTYDPVSHYRAAAVIEFFERNELTLPRLRAHSLVQTQRLLDGLSDFELLTPKEPEMRGGFVALRTPEAGSWVESLRARGIWVDCRGDALRLGPAPYTTVEELELAVEALRQLRE